MHKNAHYLKDMKKSGKMVTFVYKNLHHINSFGNAITKTLIKYGRFYTP